MRLNFSSSGRALPDLRKDINAGGTSSVPEVSSSRRLPSSNSSSSASVSATWALTGFFPLSLLSLLGQRRCIWPFWWQWKHSTVLRQFVDSSSALAARPLIFFFQLLLDRVLSARVSIAFGFGVGILTPTIRASGCVEILGLPPVVEVFFGVSSNIPRMFWTAVLS